jgi:hypothetical protein
MYLSFSSSYFSSLILYAPFPTCAVYIGYITHLPLTHFTTQCPIRGNELGLRSFLRVFPVDFSARSCCGGVGFGVGGGGGVFEICLSIFTCINESQLYFSFNIYQLS